MPCTRPNQRKAALARRDRRPSIGLSSDVKSTFHFGIERIYPAQTVLPRRTHPPIRVHATRPAIVATRCAELAELADATVSKTVVRKDVWVRVPHSALALGCPLLAESACGGRSLFLLGAQPPDPARRCFAPRTLPDTWLRQVGIVRFGSGQLPQASRRTPGSSMRCLRVRFRSLSDAAFAPVRRASPSCSEPPGCYGRWRVLFIVFFPERLSRSAATRRTDRVPGDGRPIVGDRSRSSSGSFPSNRFGRWIVIPYSGIGWPGQRGMR